MVGCYLAYWVPRGSDRSLHMHGAVRFSDCHQISTTPAGDEPWRRTWRNWTILIAIFFRGYTVVMLPRQNRKNTRLPIAPQANFPTMSMPTMATVVPTADETQSRFYNRREGQALFLQASGRLTKKRGKHTHTQRLQMRVRAISRPSQHDACLSPDGEIMLATPTTHRNPKSLRLPTCMTSRNTDTGARTDYKCKCFFRLANLHGNTPKGGRITRLCCICKSSRAPARVNHGTHELRLRRVSSCFRF